MDQNQASDWRFSLLNRNLKAVNSVSTELIVKYLRRCLSTPGSQRCCETFPFARLAAVSFCVMICIFIRIIIQTTWLQSDQPLSLSNLIQGLSKFSSQSQYLGYVHALPSQLTPGFSLFVFDF